MLPETILQFGTGRFLRAFADLFVDRANAAGQAIGRIVVVQSTGDREALQLNAQGGRFHVLVRGLSNGEKIDRVETVASISRAVAAPTQWAAIREVARSADLRFVLSNTTEAGYKLDPADTPEANPPAAFPAKLLCLMRDRYEAGQSPLTIIPCELREQQADELRGIVLGLAAQWRLPQTLARWIENECVWLNTLVDRIVVGPPANHPVTETDALAIMAEPFAFWALQALPGASPFVQHPNIVRAADVRPYFLRKVRILNAAHTALVTRAIPKGHQTVLEAMGDSELAAWLERLLFEEIVPTVADRVDGAEQFARDTLERFRNPFLAHKLSDISQNQELKKSVRLVPTRDEFVAQFGRRPPLLDGILA